VFLPLSMLILVANMGANFEAEARWYSKTTKLSALE